MGMVVFIPQIAMVKTTTLSFNPSFVNFAPALVGSVVKTNPNALIAFFYHKGPKVGAKGVEGV
jgi:hypothetical protein